ncbi:MAG: fused MFS/spermidine synthase [Chloroflexi bacterium]|nr:fused MFS/spermidine synthase [Chloroflexota bacterium]
MGDLAETGPTPNEGWRVFPRRGGEEVRFAVIRSIVRRQTPFQHVEIADTVSFGRAFFIDGRPQSAEIDEHLYHEALIHPALVSHPAPRSVFIAGGGEGATLREVLRHPSLARAVMVDIDPDAVAFCRDHLGLFHRGALDDPRAIIRHDDARAYLARSADRYDCLVVDVTDPLAGGPSYLLFTREFFALARERVNPEGLLVVQAECTALNNCDGHLSIVRTLRELFPIVRPYEVYVPFFADPWGFVVATAGVDPWSLSGAEVDRRLAARGIVDLRFYDGTTHEALKAWPRHLRDRLPTWDRIITDEDPLFVP